jgi:hypothetical protein
LIKQDGSNRHQADLKRQKAGEKLIPSSSQSLGEGVAETEPLGSTFSMLYEIDGVSDYGSLMLIGTKCYPVYTAIKRQIPL